MFRIRICKKEINRLFLFLIIIWYLLPIASNKIGTVGLVAIIALWCFSCNINVLISCFAYKPFVWFLLWYGYMLLMLLFGIYKDSNSLYFFTMTFLFALPIVIYRYYAVEDDDGLKIAIRKITILILLAAVVNTFVILQQYPLAAKIMAMSGAQEAEKQIYASMGCGGYNFIYSLVVALIPVIFTSNTLNGFWKILILAMAAISLIVIFMSQYTLSIILLISNLVLCMIYKNTNSSTSRTAAVFSVILLTAILYFLLPQMLTFFSGLIPDENGISTRLMQIASYMTTGEQGYDLGGRFERYRDSFQAFLNSPLFGIGLMGNGRIGGHSSLLDQLGRYGLVGTLPYFLFLITNYKFVNSINYKRFLKPTYITFAVLSLFNTTIYVYPIGMVMLFIIPMISEDEKTRIDKQV